MNEYIVYNVYEGSVNGEMFQEFVEYKVLPFCTSFPDSCFIIIIDNVIIYNISYSFNIADI